MKSEKSKKSQVKEFYVNPDEMWEELDSFYSRVEKSKTPESEAMSNELGKMIDDIATKLGFMGKFINYSFKNDMIGDARVKMVKAVYDRNFTLWNTFYCTEPETQDNKGEYVIIYSTSRMAWDDKKTYLKSWDTITPLESPAICVIPDGTTGILLTPSGDQIFNKITVKNNPFSYFTKIAYHAFVNRIKKEKKVSDVLAAYQEKIYEEIYSSGNGWENAKRQLPEDENEYYYEYCEQEHLDEPDYIPPDHVDDDF